MAYNFTYPDFSLIRHGFPTTLAKGVQIIEGPLYLESPPPSHTPMNEQYIAGILLEHCMIALVIGEGYDCSLVDIN